MKSNYHNRKKRDECYFCHCGPPLREHHIIPQRFGGPDSAQNIVEVCDLCHKRLERLYDKSFYEWFGINDEKGERYFHRPCAQYGCDSRPDVLLDYSNHDGYAAGRTGSVVYCKKHALEHVRRYYSACVDEVKLEEYELFNLLAEAFNTQEPLPPKGEV